VVDFAVPRAVLAFPRELFAFVRPVVVRVRAVLCGMVFLVAVFFAALVARARGFWSPRSPSPDLTVRFAFTRIARQRLAHVHDVSELAVGTAADIALVGSVSDQHSRSITTSFVEIDALHELYACEPRIRQTAAPEFARSALCSRQRTGGNSAAPRQEGQMANQGDQGGKKKGQGGQQGGQRQGGGGHGSQGGQKDQGR
jgi:hypothetical protein